MRVLQLISSTGFYGAEAVVATLARNLRSNGIETCVGHIRYDQPNVLRLEEYMPDCEVFTLTHNGKLDLGLVRNIRSEIERRDIQAIHCHGYKPDFYGGLAARALGIPIVSTCHLWTKATRALRAYARLDSVMLRHFDRVVAVSEAIRDELKVAGVPAEKLVYIPNGIAMTQYISALPMFRHLFPSGTFIFGAACRQVDAKGVDILLQAACRICGLVPRAGFLIAGDGPKLEEYRQMAKALGLDRKVLFLGRCEMMPEFYASLDTFVLPSLDEGLPIALLEAMASGRTVVATNVGAVKSVVRNEETGLLIEPGSVEALASALLFVSSNRERLTKFGSAARAYVMMNCSSQKMVGRYADLYREVLEHDGVLCGYRKRA